MKKLQKNNYFRETLGVMFSNLPFIQRLFLICVVVSLMIPFFITKKFTLTGEIIVFSKKIQQSIQGDITGGEVARYIPVTLTDMETENSIIRSIPLIRKTVSSLYDEGDLYIEHSLFEEWINTYVKEPIKTYIVTPIKSLITDDIVDERRKLIDSLLEMVLDSLEVSTIPGSNIITVNYDSENEEMALKFVNRLMTDFLMKRNELLLNEAPDDYLLKKKESYGKRLVFLELKKVKIFNHYSVTKPKEELGLIIESIDYENKQLYKILDSKIENNAWLIYLVKQLDILKGASIDKISFPYSFGGTAASSNDFYVDTEMKGQILKISSLQSEYIKALLSFHQESPKVTQPMNQLKREKKRLIVLVENRIMERTEGIRVLDIIIDNKNERIRGFKDRAMILKEVAAQEAGIVTELLAVNDAYFKYSQQYEERRSEKVAMLNDLSNVRILSLASLPLGPSSPKPILVLIISLVTSAFIALILGLVRVMFDNRICYPEQVSTQMDIQILVVFDDNDIAPSKPFSYKPKGFFEWLIQ